jgi:FimV-like protein
MHGHVSSVDLDLAKVYLSLGHRPAARELLLEVLEICRALDIKHQAREAHALLQG